MGRVYEGENKVTGMRGESRDGSRMGHFPDRGRGTGVRESTFGQLKQGRGVGGRRVGVMIIDCTQFTFKKAGMGHEKIRDKMAESVGRKKGGMGASMRRQGRVSDVCEGNKV